MTDDLETDTQEDVEATETDRGATAPAGGVTETAAVGDVIEVELRRGDGTAETETVTSEGSRHMYEALAVVHPGDVSGWAQLVNMSLGLADSNHYGDGAVELVREIQDEHDLDVDGIVAGLTWAHILPYGPVATIQNVPKVVLCRLLHLQPTAHPKDIATALFDKGYEGDEINAEVWAWLITERTAEKGGQV